MENAEWIAMIRLIPASQHNQLVVVLLNGTELSVDIIFRLEANFMVIRGRVAGTTDEGRAFLVPYQQMLYLRIERKVKLEELAALFGETMAATVSILDAPEAVTSPVSTGITIEQPTDPAITARNALLDRIRAARAATTAASKMGTGS